MNEQDLLLLASTFLGLVLGAHLLVWTGLIDKIIRLAQRDLDKRTKKDPSGEYYSKDDFDRDSYHYDDKE